MERKDNNGRKLYIDAIKGWLMLLVIWSHSRAWIDPPGYFLTAGYMGEFFFLMGYTSTHWNEKGIIYLKKKSQRLLLPFVVYGSFLILFYILKELWKGVLTLHTIKLCVGGFLYNAYKIKKSSETVLLVCDNNTFWFMTTMFVASMIAYIVIYCFKKGIISKMVVLMLFISSGILLNYYLNSYLLPWGIDTAFVAATLILSGLLYKKMESNKNYLRTEQKNAKIKMVEEVILILVYCGLVKANPGINMAIKEYGPNGLLSIAAFISISVIGGVILLKTFGNTVQNNWLMKSLGWLGKHSVTFMAIQIFTIRRMNSITMKYIDNMYIVGVIAICGTLIIGVVWCQILNKLKFKFEIFNYL